MGLEHTSSNGGGGVESVTGNIVDNSDPLNPVVNSPSRVLNVNTTTAGTPNNTNLTTLASYTIPANTLSTNGDFIDIQVSWSGDALTETIANISIGGQVITAIDLTGTGFGVTFISLNIRFIRVDGTNQKVSVISTYPSNGMPSYPLSIVDDTPSLTLSGSLALLVTGQNVSAAANALVFESLTITKN